MVNAGEMEPWRPREIMSQERLSGLAVLSIENQRARQLDLGDVVKEFAKKNARREGRFGRY